MTCWRFSPARSWLNWPAEAAAGCSCVAAVAASFGAPAFRLLSAGLALLLAVAVIPVCAVAVRAENWRANVYNEGLPSHLVAVDKNRQTFLFFEKKSPLKLKYSFPCVTGQLAGDKQELNDLRTPEGIYFVEYKIASGLDFREYGGIAYTLNYPNPVDRLRGKTGHGIWIHSKGFGLVPTRGCVAIGLKEIDMVGPRLTPGTAVVLAERLDESKVPQPDNGTARELRRLYWQRGQDKKFRIVGMEWTPRDVGMRADFQKGRLVAAALPPPATDASAEAPLPPRLDMPEAPGETAASGIPAVPAAVAQAEKLLAVSNPLVPRRAPAPPPAEINWGGRPGMETDREETPPAAKMPSAPETPPVLPEPAPPAAPQAPEAPEESMAPEALSLTPETRAALEQAVQGWNTAFAARSLADMAALYDRERYNRLPGVPRGQSYNSVQRDLERRFRAPWLTLISRAPSLELQGTLAVSRCEQLVVAPDGAEQGVRTLWWQREADGNFRIVGSQFKPEELGLAAHYLEDVSNAVSADLEAWRKAWEGGRLDDYMSFYAPDAVQQGRWGAKNIRRQKESLWARTRPTLVQLSGLRLLMDKRGIRADMNQVYADSTGHSDRGTKTLMLRFDGRNWRIQREDWVAQTPQPVGGSPAAPHQNTQRAMP